MGLLKRWGGDEKGKKEQVGRMINEEVAGATTKKTKRNIAQHKILKGW